MDDNNWHSLHYMRRAHEIRLKVDNVTVKSILELFILVSINCLMFFSYYFVDDTDMKGAISLRWQGVLVGGSSPKDPDALANLPSFIGSIQQFIINKINYFDLAKISARGC